ncbi:hypothetical protein IPG41_05510 [Candidatus Peregrinibacteria bacterium]|nr:MAG: hypothetical protein IPG41_05510 [Candidatus Peregrinibacteria bacterium]
MRKNEFLHILKEDLPEDQYKSRLLRELEDHWDDCHAQGSVKKADQSLGDPHQFISFYKDVMKKNTPLYLEALFIGLCSMPMMFLPFIGNSFTEITENFLAKGALWILTLGMAGFLYSIFYRWVWTRLTASQKIEDSLAKKLTFLLLVPGWYVIGLVAVILYDEQMQDHIFPLMIMSYTVVQLFVAWKARSHALSVQANKIMAILGFSLGIICLVLLSFFREVSLEEVLYSMFYFVRLGLFVPFGMHRSLGVISLGVVAFLTMTYSFSVVFYQLVKGEGACLGQGSDWILLSLWTCDASCRVHFDSLGSTCG